MNATRPTFWKSGRAVACFATALGLSFAFTQTNPRLPAPLRAACLDLYPILPQLACLLMGIFLYRLRRQQTRLQGLGWLLFGIGCALNVPAACYWAWFDGVLVQEPPIPSVADLFYLLAYPFQIAGVLCLFQTTTSSRRPQVLLDGAIVTSVVAVAVWALVGEGLWRESSVSALGKIVTLAQPVCDVATLFAALLLVSLNAPHRQEQISRIVLALGLAIFCLGDLLFTRDSLTGSYYTGIWYEGSWTLAATLMAVGTWISWRNGSGVDASIDESDSPRAATQLLLPSALLITAAGAVLLDGYKSLPGHLTRHLGALSFPITIALIRQVYLVIEHSATTARLEQHEKELEQTVAQSRLEIDTLHELIEEVSRSLEEDEVWATVLTRTRSALGAFETGVWVPFVPETGATCSVPLDGGPGQPALLRLHRAEAARPGFGIAWMFEGVDIAPHLTTIQMALPRGDMGFDRTAVCVYAPIVWRDRYYGAIGILYDAESAPAEEPRLLVDIGRAVAPAVANARSYAEVRDAADRDPVTGLLNHRAIHQRLRNALDQAAEDERPVSVLMIDVDHFKLFNDTHGHLAGDAILRKVGRLLTESTPPGTAIGRYGGDEFCVVLPGMDAERADRLGASLNARLDREGISVQTSKELIPLSLSVGSAEFPRDGLHRHELMAQADRNMYRAKRQGMPVSESARQIIRFAADLQQAESMAALEAMVLAIDNKDQYTRAHSEDVTEFAGWIAQAMGWGESSLRTLRVAGLLHDIGKIGVPDEVLRKPGTLTPAEFEAMKRHCAIGALIVGAMPGMTEVVPAIRGHHERWDGTGYPDGLTGLAIPIFARVLAVADAFSAMTTDRPYRKAIPWERALQQIEEGAGTQFDAELSALFVVQARQRFTESASRKAA